MDETDENQSVIFAVVVSQGFQPLKYEELLA